jgi:hypothetical protein
MQTASGACPEFRALRERLARKEQRKLRRSVALGQKWPTIGGGTLENSD